ncbi:metallophosphoesterase [Symbiopectobacterium purcellii]|uniref:metallophosphoesterase n=1 Tax=Symbiopectobacterium purcellii TaxID=2871826 RepID=UPI003F86CA99
MRFVHLTDLHLTKELPSDENYRFEKLIGFLAKNKSIINFDKIIVTGDISNNGERESYEYFFSHMDSLDIPYSAFPGNHDDTDNMRVLSSGAVHHKDLSLFSDEHWSLIKVNTVVPGKDYGFINEKELSMLEHMLLTNRGKKIAVFLHHHPLEVGTPLVDSCMLQNSGDFLGLCMSHNVKFIAAGHAHTSCQQRIGQIFVSIAPAVCYQWVNGTSEVEKFLESGFSIVSLDDQIHSETYFI